MLMILAWSCSSEQNPLLIAEKSITAGDLGIHIEILASDEFEGRKPFTPGEKKTTAYIRKEFERIGLEPGNNGSYFQDVPMVEIKAEISEIMEINTGETELGLKRLEDYTAFTRRISEEINIDDVELVFAGFGIVAPEYNWNDYEDLDVTDKIVLVMVNDPGYGTENKDLFKGHEMTYYGRWTYKYEEAARQGARGILIIHQTGPAGYPWAVVRNGAEGSKLYLQPDDGYENRCELEGWITMEAADKLFRSKGVDREETMKLAAKPGFKGFPMNATVTVSIHNHFRYDFSNNVMVLIRGTDRADEVLIYTAHWDHLGIGRAIDGDSIYNGATDNASAVSWMLEIAEAFSKLPEKPSRSLLFLAVTAEEQGLLGAAYYVSHPLFPIEKSVANINTDVILFLGRFRDVTITGFGQSELDDMVERLAKKQDRYILPDPNPENGMYFRSDHFEFARAGIPSIFAKGYSDQVEKGKEWTAEKISDYWKNVYHKPADEYDMKRDNLDGLVEDAVLFFRLGYELANSDQFPEWKPGSEFKQIRDKSMNLK